MELFVLLLEEIPVLSWGFPFVALSRSFRLRFRAFVARNTHTVVSLPLSVSQLELFCFSLCCHCCYWPLFFFALFNIVFGSSYRCTNAIFNAEESSLSSFFLDIYSLWRLSDVKHRYNFLILCSICLSSSLTHFKNGLEYLTRGLSRCLSC